MYRHKSTGISYFGTGDRRQDIDPFLGIVRTALERLGISLVLATCAASGMVVFVPWMQANVDPKYHVVAAIVFVFSLTWITSEFVRFVTNTLKTRSLSRTRALSDLSFDIFQLLSGFSRPGGAKFRIERRPEAAASIATIYERLRSYGIATPKFDPLDENWDFDANTKFLSELRPVLNNGPRKFVKSYARKLVDR